MVDLTSLVRKPPSRGYAAGVEFKWRTVVAGLGGVVLVAPMAFLLARFQIYNVAILVVVAGAALGPVVTTWRPDGVPFSVWVSSKLRRQNRTVLEDGTEVALHVGLAPVREDRSGQQVTLVFPAVEVAPERLGPRGNLIDTS